MSPEISLDILVQKSLERCLSRLSRISTGSWRAAMVNTYTGTPGSILSRYAAEPMETVFLKLAGLPLAGIMLVKPDDIQCVSRGFTGHSFPSTGKMSKADEIMFTELSNILLNALLNPVTNFLKEGALPELPYYLEGNAQALIAGLKGRLGPDKTCRVISAAICLQCEGLAAWTLHAFIPEDLASGIEQR